MSEAEQYEAERQARIARNKRQLSELGLLAACNDLREVTAQQRPKKIQRREPAAPRIRLDPSQLRRSGRSEGKAAPVYNDNILDEACAPRRSKSCGKRIYSDTIEGHPLESYSEAQQALLGGCEKEWELFVDGFDASGQRIYDRVEGKTCHQCRQKTMGKRTSCFDCQSLTGVYCGDCLFMRYGENVDEAIANPQWKCPHCRDPTLCNCSQHRTRLGWGPTGSLYRKVKALGYKSVAHYLVETHLAKDESPAPVAAVAAAAEATEEPPAPATPPLQSEEEAILPSATAVVTAKEKPARSEKVPAVAKAPKTVQLALDDILVQRKFVSSVIKGNKPATRSSALAKATCGGKATRLAAQSRRVMPARGRSIAIVV